jgi:outer membrane lipoprotein-sorting protein
MFFRRMRTFLAIFVGVGLLATGAYPVIQHLLANDRPSQQVQTGAPQNPAPGAGQEQPPAPKVLSAKETFDQLEKKLAGAKTMRCTFEITSKANDQQATMKGKLVIAEGSKALLELEGDVGGNKLKMLTITDGKKVMNVQNGKKSIKVKEGDDINNALTAALARSGLALPWFTVTAGPGIKEEKIDPAKMFPVSDLKLGKSENIGGKQATVLHYKLGIKDEKTPIETTVWLDAKTGLPFKRELTFNANGQSVKFTEAYTECIIDQPIDPSVFKIDD